MSRNFLREETSPYLLQHADNPVHWRPWGEEALAAAKREKKPILLSVGYAACHWCHVMAHESFEDEGVAAVMNEHFINIKVDREERPDIDAIYMSALHLLGQQGGWPLTMFLTPEGEPFWGGTYFPKEAAYGRPGFTDVLTEVARIFREEPAKVYKNRQALVEALQKQSATARPGEPTPQVPVVVAEKLVEIMDPENGGIRGAPKFPQVPLLSLMWRAHLRTGREDFAAPVTRALDHMSEGGIYDHLGGGYARYSVDEFWLAPHFEKMLYDNALLIDLLTLTWAETRKPLYERRVRETVEWVAREMLTDGGGFAASLDADSEGEEGKFYVWSEAEIDQTLNPGEATLFKRFYGVTAPGNWEGTNILNRLARADEPVTAEEEAALEPLRARLFAERDMRVHPGFDDKVLADWNGLMIGALARAGATFGEAQWVEMAADAFRFVMETMRVEGRLHHAWRDGKLQHIAMADDLANMADAAVALAEATGDEGYVAEAESLVAELNAHYRDAANGGYFFTADDAPTLIVRRRTVADDATPAANGTLPGTLTKLALLTGKGEYFSRADELIRAFAGELQQNIFPLGSYIASLDTRLRPVQVVLIGGPEETAELAKAAFGVSCPARILMRVKDGKVLPEGHPAHGKEKQDGKPTAYVCAGETCSLPVTEVEALVEELKRARTNPA
ncbi:thioredoxin domain-containing protein [Parvibaculum sp.]|uniref:thioredoxin domain-containing protein n=1 Tax=Parvibaculum sp. TaxID=2024848 RepID=UPI001B16925B|nr:thioredoxin domain-containing protein [Parvibaculum sp.]MBO6668432.1 thioredoxin domain-containing protein [Parvibaculum sp.]MBO6691321.1 thioredoxin domain-containing protein [Parvibaculum sp.]MBO6715367.1 thioredoxin domain-containing protein [Parvibaculum sp.]